jgi:hypothetical protein
LIVRIRDADIALQAGDSRYLDPHVSHSYRRGWSCAVQRGASVTTDDAA